MKLLNVIIEPIEERYSTQWRKWFDAEFEKQGILNHTILGNSKRSTISHGSFLDVLQTNQYKAWQTVVLVNQLCEYKDEEKLVLFFHDLWHPGLTNLAYIRDGMGFKNVKICGCLHAGSYDEYDFLNKTGMTTWAKHTEIGWFADLVDEIYVATQFHKDLICRTRKVPKEKIIVTGFPIYPEFEDPQPKKKMVVFPHRLDSEKQPDLFDKLATECYRPDWTFVKTKEICKTKEEYYQILNQAAISVSFALQETWGIAMQESVLCGAVPIVPNRLSYSEMYLTKFLYDTKQSFKNTLFHYMDQYNTEEVLGLVKTQQNRFLRQGNQAIGNIISKIKEL